MVTVLICVLCLSERQGWVNPWLAGSLCAMVLDPRFNVSIEFPINHRPYHVARNRAIALARDRGVDWLVMIDNDQSFAGISPLDVLAAAGSWRKIIGMMTFASEMKRGELVPNIGKEVAREGDWTEREHVGGGVLCIHSEVWQKIPGPWFLNQLHDDEMGTQSMGEDWWFCEKVRKHGYKVWVHRGYASHWHMLDVTDVALTLAQTKHGKRT